MDGEECRLVVREWYRVPAGARRPELIRLVRIYGGPERWEVRRTPGGVTEHPTRGLAEAAVARTIGDAWVEVPQQRRKPGMVVR
jgi:hypothetical protein